MTKILVIEDMQSLRENIVEALELLDFEALGAENGLVGVQFAQEHLPDLIICDIMMPELDGYGVLEALRQVPETATIPFIFLSAKADKTDIRQGMNKGADDYLTKPFTIEELRSAIAARLEKQAARQRIETKLRSSESQFRQLAQREELLNYLASQIRNSLDLNTIMKAAVSEIRKLLQIERCRFLWYRNDVEPAYFELIYEASDPNLAVIPSCHIGERVAVLEEAVAKLDIFRVDNVFTDVHIDRQNQESIKNLGLASVLAISIKTNSERIGVVICEQFTQPRPWSDDEVALIKAVADQLAIAIDQAELYAQSRFAATTARIQASQLEKALSELQNTQAQLIQTEKMSSLGQLIAGVAHEINNPVNFIYGNVDYVRDYVQELLQLLLLYQENYPNPTPQIKAQTSEIDVDFLMEDLPKVLSSMEMGADRIREIVQSLRNFSRTDEAAMKPVDIHEGLDNTLLILQNQLKSHDQFPEILVIKEYGDLPLVECYAGQLNQVFMNIISNAVDAIKADSSWVEISEQNPDIKPHIQIRTTIDDSDDVGIEITDNGPGMTTEVIKRLFDPFFTTKPVGKGTGLGLSISYQIIVEKHKGTINCWSEVGKGTTFHIKIPSRQKQ